MFNTNSFSFFMFTWIGVFVFCAFLLTLIFWRLKIKNFGLSLAASYSVTVILATVTVYNIRVDEPGWYFMGVLILGLPLGALTMYLSDFVNIFISSIGINDGGPASNGFCLALGGSFQYYLIGALIQKFIKWNWLKNSKNEN